MTRTLLIGVTVGFALGLVFTVAWQPSRASLAVASDQVSQIDKSDRAVVVDDDGPSVDRVRTRERQVTPGLVERVIEVARRIDPPMAEYLRALCDERPDEVEQVLRTRARRLVALADLQIRDPELYDNKMMELETEAEIEQVARQIVTARLADDDSRVEVLQEQLRTTVQVHIALSIKARGDSIRRLEEHIRALRDELERDAANFEVNVRTRIQQAIDQAEREHEETVVRSR